MIALRGHRRFGVFLEGTISAVARGMRHSHPVVAATSTALPRHHYSQQKLAQAAHHLFPAFADDSKTVERLFQKLQVKDRYFAMPIEAYSQLAGLAARNEAWLATSLELGERAVRAVLERAEIEAGEVDMMMTTSVTGVAVPSLDARLMNRLPFPRSMKRVPMFGLGCVAGVSGLARASEYLRAYPCQTAVFLSVELCSLTMQPKDASPASIIATGMFGDGAAAVLLAGPKHPLSQGTSPRIVDSRSRFFPDSERALAWDVVDTGFRAVMSSKVQDLTRAGIAELVDGLLSAHGLTRNNIESWIAHPGGPQMFDTICEALELDPSVMALARKGLAEVGNLSSASVLFALDELRATVAHKKGSFGVMVATGPGLCAEAVLLGW